MEIARIRVDRNALQVEQYSKVTQGLIGAAVIFEEFGPEWNGLSKTAVFRTSESSRDVVNVLKGEPVAIPWEVLDSLGADLMLGICGTSEDGAVVIPSIWGSLGKIYPGAHPAGRPAEPPTPDWTQQIEGQVNEALEQVQKVYPLTEKSVVCANAANSFAYQAEDAKNKAYAAAERLQTALNSLGTSVEDARNAAQTAAGSASAAESAQAAASGYAAAAREGADAAAQSEGSVKSDADRAAAAAAETLQRADAVKKYEKTARKAADQAAVSAEASADSAAQASQSAAASSIAAARAETAAQTCAADAEEAKIGAERARQEAERAKAEADRAAERDVEKIAIKPTVLGNVLSLDDSADWPLMGLHLFGRTTQDGTPSPEHPCLPLTAGAGGTITCRICGRNLVGNLTYMGNQSQKNASLVTVRKEDWESVLVNGRTYTVSCDISADNGTACYCVWNEKIGMPAKAFYVYQGTYRYSCTFVKSPWIGAELSEPILYKRDNEGNTCHVRNLMVEYGGIEHPYEEHRTASYVFSGPNGLPGVPVNEGGNYKDAAGREWICDELNFERGVYIKRIFVGEISADDIQEPIVATTSGSTWGLVKRIPRSTILHTAPGEIICDCLPGIAYWQGDDDGVRGACIANYDLRLYWNSSDNVQTISDIRQWFDKLNRTNKTITVIYPTAPEEIPIAPELMEAYRKMHTNYLATTIYNDAAVHQQVQYVADPVTYIDHALDRIAAVENRLEPLNGGM